MQIRVSGNSPVLKWLVEGSLERTPWLRLEGKDLHIDWDQVVERWHASNPRAARSPSLPRVLRNLLPVWPLASVLDLDAPAWQHGDRALATSIEVEPTAIPAPAVRALDELGDQIDELLGRIDDPRYADAPLDTVRRNLRTLREATTGRQLRRTQSIRYHLSRRLVVAKADMRIFLRGETTLASRGAGPDRRRRLESWRLARSLVRAHIGLHEHLERMVLSGMPDDAASLAEGPLAESWREIGRLERKLTRLLTSPPNPDSQGRAHGLASVELEFDDIADPDGRSPPQNRYETHLFTPAARGTRATPFGSRLALLEETTAILHPLKQHAAGTQELLSSVKAAATAAKATLAEHALDAAKSPSKGVDARDLDEVIDWLIAESPLLTLFVGGFLSTYLEDTELCGICLSPWVAATLTAKRQVGPLPMTYLGMGHSEDSADDQPDFVETAAPAESPRVSGRSIWEHF